MQNLLTLKEVANSLKIGTKAALDLIKKKSVALYYLGMLRSVGLVLIGVSVLMT